MGPVFRALTCLTLALACAYPLAATAEATCRAIADPLERLECYDQRVDETSAEARSSSSESSGPPAVPDDDSAESSSVPTKAAAEATAEFGKRAHPGRSVETVTATVSRVERLAYGKIRISLDNGQIWRQLDSKRIRLAAGDTATIKAGHLDSYRLRKEGATTAIRVKRVD